MASDSSNKAVVLAIVGNAFLTVLKFITFALSGSGAMLSEAIHSLADTGNQALLFIGIRRSQAPANSEYHYGFGAERFFYALMSAVGIFVLGCGVTIYHGIHSALDPHMPEVGWPVFAVLGVSFLVDGFVMWKAVGAVNEVRGERGFFEYLRSSSDPTLAAVLLEDGVATSGVLVALFGILGTQWLGSPWPDIAATIVIGIMLGFVAVWLGYKNRGLILGLAIPPDVERHCIEYLESCPAVERVRRVKSRIVGADRFKFTAEVDWDGKVLAAGFADWVESQAEELGTPEGRAQFTRDFGERLTTALGAEIDRVEGELRKLHPELAFVDLESDATR